MNEKQLFEYLVSLGFTPEGAAGLMGNLKAESNLNPRNLQNSCEARLNFTDDSYTEAVDNGTYDNFVRDSAGYGLAQWTYWNRKRNLLKFAKSNGLSIGDMEMQVSFMYLELQGYKEVFRVLRNTRSIQEASDIVLTQYEKPANQSDSVKRLRAEYGRQIYERCTAVDDNADVISSEAQLRNKVVNIAINYLGCNEGNGTHKAIIDIYNQFRPLARGYKVKYTDSWCATFCSAVAITAGLTDIIPTECSCGQMISLFQKLNRWVENDGYTPNPGDYVFYDWNDTGVGNCTGFPEHVGIVVAVVGKEVVVIEGNINNAVGYRNLVIDGRFIRGYGIPDYDSKVTAEGVKEPDPGVSNNSSNTSGTKGGLCLTPQWVGKVIPETLNVRKWAGTEYDKLKSCPQLLKDTTVEVCDGVKTKDGTIWYYIRIDGRIYGFVHSDYIQVVSVTGGSQSECFKVGDIVKFTGNKHYASSYSGAKERSCKPGTAKITAINNDGCYPYHLVNVSGEGSTVYGWVKASDVNG